MRVFEPVDSMLKSLRKHFNHSAQGDQNISYLGPTPTFLSFDRRQLDGREDASAFPVPPNGNSHPVINPVSIGVRVCISVVADAVAIRIVSLRWIEREPVTKPDKVSVDVWIGVISEHVAVRILVLRTSDM